MTKNGYANCLEIISLLNRIEVWLTLGLLALNLSFAIERYAPSNTVSEFVTGLLIGLSVAANIYAIWQTERTPCVMVLK